MAYQLSSCTSTTFESVASNYRRHTYVVDLHKDLLPTLISFIDYFMVAALAKPQRIQGPGREAYVSESTVSNTNDSTLTNRA